ncbi:DNA topoisomerase III [Bacillus amyloliquefaciens]|uniref:type IA DNA topoisomerase n=1 Tax=Bacillus amyloliquefaciens TaxID=1390 RepID=UPI002FF54F43
MKPVILAEKALQAKEFIHAKALKPNVMKDGYYEIQPNEVFKHGALLTWASGHLLELAEPHTYKEEWKKWDVENLPIIPDNFSFVVSEARKKQFGIIKELLKNTNEIIVATDPDREGENIAYSIIEKCGCSNKKFKRLWINSLQPNVVNKGFENLLDASKTYPYYIEAQTRQKSDWLIGMNATRLYTELLRAKGLRGVYSVGRVQTPTLFMIYEREREIENFVPKPFFEIEGNAEHENGKFTVKVNGKLDTKNEALEILGKNQVSLKEPIITKITKVNESIEKESSPKLFTLASLQSKANKLWKYSPSKVLDTVQKLYVSKLVSYPRTDTPYITESEFSYLANNISSYQNIIGAEFEIKNSEPKKRYVNPKEVLEHYALIPTDKIPTATELNKLSEIEKNIYQEIVRNTVAMFHREYEYSKTTIHINFNNLVFMTTGKTELDEGWKELFPKNPKSKGGNEEEKDRLPVLKEGDEISLNVNIKEGKTTKPKRFTEGQLIPMMESCGKNVEDEDDKKVLKENEGIGTSATRASIIETLKNQEYIKIEKNTVFVTQKGVILCEAVNGTLLSSPALTAKWEKFLKMIGKGERDSKTFLNSIEKFIYKLIEEVPDQIETLNIEMHIEKTEQENSLGGCPSCKKGHIVERGKLYGCSEYSSGCKQTFPKELLSKEITVTQMKKLLDKGKTNVIKGFKGSKTFDSFLTIELDKDRGFYKYKFNFAKKAQKK